jgi:hypothetical protein
VNALHITALVFINDDERGLRHDDEEWPEELAPHEPIGQYLHNRTGEDNARAHLKRQAIGREVVVAVTDGSTLAPGSRAFTGSLTVAVGSGYWYYYRGVGGLRAIPKAMGGLSVHPGLL